VSVLDCADNLVVNIPLDLVLVPFQSIDVIVLHKVIGRLPLSPLGPVLLFCWGTKYMNIGVIYALVFWVSSADLEHVYLCPFFLRRRVEPERA